MKKQKSRLSLGFLLLFAGCIVSATPLKVYAGQNGVNGTSVDSSTFSGNTFNRTNQSAPGTNVSVEVNGTISVPPQVQRSLNSVATRILGQGSCGDFINSDNCFENPRSTMVVILVRGSGDSAATSEVKTSLSSSGVSQSLITGLVNNLAGLFKSFDTAAIPGVTVAGLQPAQLLANNQLAFSGEAYSEIVLEGNPVLVNNLGSFFKGFDFATRPNVPIVGLLPLQVIVDVRQLNVAIKAYNSIVLKSDEKALKKLSINPEFVEVGRVLKELRASLRARY